MVYYITKNVWKLLKITTEILSRHFIGRNNSTVVTLFVYVNTRQHYRSSGTISKEMSKNRRSNCCKRAHGGHVNEIRFHIVKYNMWHRTWNFRPISQLFSEFIIVKCGLYSLPPYSIFCKIFSLFAGLYA